MKYRGEQRTRELQAGKEETKEEEGGGLLVGEGITLAERSVRHLLTTPDKCCETFVQESPDA